MVPEPVSEKFGTGKSTGIGIEKIWYRKKVSVSVSFKILGTVTLWFDESKMFTFKVAACKWHGYFCWYIGTLSIIAPHPVSKASFKATRLVLGGKGEGRGG